MKKPIFLIGFILLSLIIYYYFYNCHESRKSNTARKSEQALIIDKTSQTDKQINNTKEQSSDTLSANSFGVAGVFVYSTKEEVIKKLGEPLQKKQNSIESFQNPEYTSFYEVWYYEGLEIEFFSYAKKGTTNYEKPFFVKSIIIKNESYKTNYGIGINSTTKELISKYGEGLIKNNTIVYSNEDGYISFTISNGNIIGIEMGYQFD